MTHIYVPSRGVEDWRRLLRDPVNHWEPSRSAHSTAVVWEAAGGEIPAEIRRVLESANEPTLRGLRLLLALPEHETSLPDGGLAASHSDVLALARGDRGLVVITVEGKAGEDFDETVADWLCVDRFGKRTVEPSASRQRRLEELANALGLALPMPGDVRYQLFHRALAATIEARRFGAREAVMVVHAFGEKCEAGFAQYKHFLDLFGSIAVKNGVCRIVDLDDVCLRTAWIAAPLPEEPREFPADAPRFTHVMADDGWLTASLADGRRVQVPMTRYPELAAASHDARQGWRVVKGGLAVHWPALKLRISVDDVCTTYRADSTAPSVQPTKTSVGAAPAHVGAAGVDGYDGGWVAAVDADNGRTRIVFFDGFMKLLAAHESIGGDMAGPVVLDIPIGLPASGARACDLEARRLVGPRRSSVFAAPIRPVLDLATYEDACAVGREVEGKALSKQTFAILPRIAEVDRHMTPARQSHLREGHPEVSFRLLAGAPLVHGKATAAGREERWALLVTVFPDLEAQVAPYRKRSILVDILDAYALLWSARRLAAGIAQTLPGTPEVDARGLRVEMIG